MYPRLNKNIMPEGGDEKEDQNFMVFICCAWPPLPSPNGLNIDLVHHHGFIKAVTGCKISLIKLRSFLFTSSDWNQPKVRLPHLLWIQRLLARVSLRFWTVGQEAIAPGQDCQLGYILLLETLIEMLKAAHSSLTFYILLLGKLKWVLLMVTTQSTMYTSQFWVETKPWTSTSALIQAANTSVPRPTRGITVHCATTNHRNQGEWGDTLKKCIQESRLYSMEVRKLSRSVCTGLV